MRRRVLRIAVGAAVVAAMAGGGIAWATSGDDGDESVTGPAAERARAAALAHVGAAKAAQVERESDGAASWEVEVERPDGSTIEVLLDKSYAVIGVEGESEDSDGAAEDEAGE